MVEEGVRAELIFEPPSEMFIPMTHYNARIAGIIYRELLGPYGDLIHDEPKRRALYTFSRPKFLGDFRKVRGGVITSEPFAITLSTMNPYLVNRLTQIKEFVATWHRKKGNLKIPVRVVLIKPDLTYLYKKQLLTTITPLLARAPWNGGRSIVALTPQGLVKYLSAHLSNKIQYYYGDTIPSEDIEGGILVKEYSPVTTILKGARVPGVRTTLRISLPSRKLTKMLLTIAYYSGLGAATTLGFGFMDIRRGNYVRS